MSALILGFERFALWAVEFGTSLAVALTLAVIVERIALAVSEARLRRTERRYRPLIARAMQGEAAAIREIAASPLRDRLSVARLLIDPLIADRDPRRIAATGAVVGSLSLAPTVDRLLKSRLWWRRALALCGTALSRPTLCEWTRDARGEVRIAAFEALTHIGLDAPAASLAIAALDSPEADVRAMAAEALQHWTDDAAAAARLGQHLDDAWTVAVRAARTLQSMPEAGMAQLRARADRPDLTGTLARQMLWEAELRR